MKTIIFDLDGTLADTSADLIAAANAAFSSAKLNIALDPIDDKATAFQGGRAMLRLGYSRLGISLSADEIETQYQVLLTHYEDNIAQHTTLYAHVEATLARLLDEGYTLGVCTNKPEYLAEKLLIQLDIRHHFSSLIGAQTVGISKPDPKPYIESVLQAGGTVENSILIGDTKTDRDTALACNIPCVLVTFGPQGDEILHLSPDRAMQDYRDLPTIAKELLS